MAYCPECNAEMPSAAIECPHCGYDFPSPETDGRQGFAYSTFADLALVVSMIAAVVGAFVAAIGTMVAIYHEEWFHGLVLGPIVFLLQIGMLVVFLRVQQ